MNDRILNTILTALEWYEDDRAECERCERLVGARSGPDYADIFAAIEEARAWAIAQEPNEEDE
jgi:hypothetical protein